MNKIILLLLLLLPINGFASDFKIGPWTLGMSKEEVVSFKDYEPYIDVQVTGGIETANGIFLGNKRNVSFVFGNDGLDYIQVWNYEGPDWKSAKERVIEIHGLFIEKFGGATVKNVNVNDEPSIDRNSLEVLLDRILGTAEEIGKKARKEDEVAVNIFFDMEPKEQPENSVLHSQWGYSSRFQTFYVFLYQDRVGSPNRIIESNIQLDKL